MGAFCAVRTNWSCSTDVRRLFVRFGLQRGHFCTIVRKAAQGAAGDIPLSGLAQLLLFTLSIHGDTRPAQYGMVYKKSQCILVIILFTAGSNM